MLKKLVISTLLLCPTLSFALNSVEVQDCFNKDIKTIETMTFEQPLTLDMFFLARQIKYNRENYESELTSRPVDEKALALLNEDLQSIKDIISSAQTCADARVGFTSVKRNPDDNYTNDDSSDHFDLAFAIGTDENVAKDLITTETVEKARDALKETGYPTAAEQLTSKHVFLAVLIFVFDPGGEQAAGVDQSDYKNLMTADQLEQSARQKLKDDQLTDTKDIYETASKILK